MRDSNWTPNTEEDRVRAGVAIGAGVGNIPDIVESGRLVSEKVWCLFLYTLISTRNNNYVAAVQKAKPIFYSTNLGQLGSGTCEHYAWFEGLCA